MFRSIIIVVVAQLIMIGTCIAREPIWFNAGAAELNGVTLDTAHTSHGDVGFLTGFTNGSESASFTVESPGGLYEAQLKYRAGGFKGYVISVNGLAYGASLAKTDDDFAASLPVRLLLQKGSNKISIGGGWGHYDIAGLNLTPIDLPSPPKPPRGGLSDKQATPEARRLWANLASVYGKKTLSGVYAEEDVKYVQEKTGKTPAILGADLSDFSASRIEHGANPGGIVDKLLQQSREGLILTLSWHWNAPAGLVDHEGKTDSLPAGQRWYMGFNTQASTFDFAAALANENSDEYRMLLRDIDAVAVPLKTLQNAGVPILWRPLHEAEGGWFWWGSKGPEAYVKLWRLVHDRLTKHDGVHDLLWVFTAGQDIKWYPGDDVVDIVGVDDYPKDNRDPLVSDWQTVLSQFGSRKLLTLSEVGFVPDLDLARLHGVYWSYYNTWNGNLGPTNLPVDELKRRFNSKFMASK